MSALFGRSLYAKLAALLFLLFGVVSVSYLALTIYASRRHFQEVNQKLNQGLAANLVKEKLLLQNGEIDQAALEDTFHAMMVIHPQIELYLLDRDGKILAFSAPEGVVERESVSLAPIEAFLAKDVKLPVLGDDPRDLVGRKVFSAAPIASKDGAHEGYVYIVLGGEEYDSAVAMLETSYVLRLSLTLMVASLVFALVAGLLLFHLSTRKLTRLATLMERFRDGDFREPPPPGEEGGDEIDRIGATFRGMARRITSQMEELEEKDRLRRELVAQVSHDLRTPLASLHGYLETLTLKHGELAPEEEREYLATATRHSERLGKLVSELFELAKLDARELELERETFSLAELVQDVVQEFKLRAAEKGVLLEAALEGGPSVVSADIRLVERVVENLVENALRFTPAGGRVTVRLSGLKLEVRDTGCGIPLNEIPQIFDRFYRTETGRQSGGTGLGLAIAKRILDLHGSRIEVDSQPGRGSAFAFELASVTES